MTTSILMPKLGMTMKEGTVVEWLKQPGDFVQAGDGVVTISSDKLTSEVEAPASGTLLKVLADVDQEVEVGGIIGIIGTEEESDLDVFQTGSGGPSVQVQGRAQQATAAEYEPVQNEKQRNKLRISPAARKAARELGVDTNEVTGTGPKGRITRRDIENYAKEHAQTLNKQAHASVANAEANVERLVAATGIEIDRDAETKQSFMVTERPVKKTINLTSMRRTIAKRMQQSISSTAQLTLHRKADINKLLEFQKTVRAEASHSGLDIKLTLTVLLARAVTLSLRDKPFMNTHMLDQKLYQYDEVHLGIATALEDGLVVPVVRHAERLPLGELAKAVQLVTEKARTGQADSSDLSGSTFTITNLGSQGIEYFTPILNTPESGILGVGSFTEELKLKGDQVVEVKKLPLSLTFDHRVMDGSPAADFLGQVVYYLEHPYLLVL